MISEQAAPLDRTKILDYFSRRNGSGSGRHLHGVAFYLMEHILSQRQFEDIESLEAFCRKPDNLGPWLPSEADRIVFGGGLVEGLGEMMSNRQ